MGVRAAPFAQVIQRKRIGCIHSFFYCALSRYSRRVLPKDHHEIPTSMRNLALSYVPKRDKI